MKAQLDALDQGASRRQPQVVGRDAPRRQQLTRKEGVVLQGTGGVWQVRADPARRTTLRCADGSSRSARNRKSSPSATGSFSRSMSAERSWAIAEILPRHSQLARRAPGEGQGERIVAANLDQVVVVFAAAKPEPHRRMLDRFLVIAEGNSLGRASSSTRSSWSTGGKQSVASRTTLRAGYPVHFTSVKQRDWSRRAARRARRQDFSAFRSVRRRQVVADERDVPGTQPARRRDQRIGEQGPPYDRRCAAPSASRRRFRRRHPGAARGRNVGAGVGSSRRMLPRAPPFHLPSASSATAPTASSRAAPFATLSPPAPSAPNDTTATCG